jgi:flagellar hook-associated protein 3 FlgL
MRVTFNTFPDTLLGRLQSLGSEQNKALTQLSTGQRISAPSDDAPAMQRVLNLRVEKKQNQQFYRNSTDGLEKSKVTFSSLEQIKNLLVRSTELAASVNGVTSKQEYVAKASEINQLIEQGLNVANTKLRGASLFAGDQPETTPFTVTARNDKGEIASISYYGPGKTSNEDVEIRIGDDAKINVGSTHAENKDLAVLLNKLIELRDTMAAPTSDTKASTIRTMRAEGDNNLNALEDRMLNSLSRAGTIQYRLEVAMKDLETRYTATEQLISTDADIDFAEATVRLNRSQMAYQAAIQSGAMIQRNSLLDYVR